MKRRHFMHAIAAVPAGSALLAQKPPVVRGRPALDTQALPVLDATISDTAAEPTHRFFSEEQFAVLRKLSDTLLPPMDGYPGAIAAGAPEFLDFLVGERWRAKGRHPALRPVEPGRRFDEAPYVFLMRQ